jgi:hypothetical protein
MKRAELVELCNKMFHIDEQGIKLKNAEPIVFNIPAKQTPTVKVIKPMEDIQQTPQANVIKAEVKPMVDIQKITKDMQKLWKEYHINETLRNKLEYLFKDSKSDDEKQKEIKSINDMHKTNLKLNTINATKKSEMMTVKENTREFGERLKVILKEIQSYDNYIYDTTDSKNKQLDKLTYLMEAITDVWGFANHINNSEIKKQAKTQEKIIISNMNLLDK